MVLGFIPAALLVYFNMKIYLDVRQVNYKETEYRHVRCAKDALSLYAYVW